MDTPKSVTNTKSSLWNDSDIEKTVSIMDSNTRYRYQKMAQELFERDSDPHVVNIEVATQVRLMLRDGIDPSMLDEEEKKIFVNIYGIDAFDAIESQKNVHKAARRNRSERVKNNITSSRKKLIFDEI
jgi:beta-N-acetylglucosaminidase